MNCIKILIYGGFIIFSVANGNNKELNLTKNEPISKGTNSVRLPFKLELPLDLLTLELKHYKDQFVGDWSNNTHAKVITEEAEILVQTTDKSLQKILKNRIVHSFFKDAQAMIYFNSNNIIIPVIKSSKKTTVLKTDKDDKEDQKILTQKEKDTIFKKPRKHKKTEAKQIVAPKKIHGARRTMKRLKKEAEERKRAEYQKTVSELNRKKEALLKHQRKNLLNQETIDRTAIELEHAKLRSELLKQFNPDISKQNLLNF